MHTSVILHLYGGQTVPSGFSLSSLEGKNSSNLLSHPSAKTLRLHQCLITYIKRNQLLLGGTSHSISASDQSSNASKVTMLIISVEMLSNIVVGGYIANSDKLA